MKVGGTWFLMDATWSAGSCGKNSVRLIIHSKAIVRLKFHSKAKMVIQNKSRYIHFLIIFNYRY